MFSYSRDVASSTNKMSESMKNALEASEIPILSRQILTTGEDFVLTFLQSTRVVDTGFLLFKLDTELYKG